MFFLQSVNCKFCTVSACTSCRLSPRGIPWIYPPRTRGKWRFWTCGSLLKLFQQFSKVLVVTTASWCPAGLDLNILPLLTCPGKFDWNSSSRWRRRRCERTRADVWPCFSSGLLPHTKKFGESSSCYEHFQETKIETSKPQFLWVGWISYS